MENKAERFSLLVRIGFLSRAILYIVLGLIALTGARKIGRGTDGIFAAIEDFPLGLPVLWLMVVGLLGYALFRLASAILDTENHGSDPSGRAKRIGHAGSAIGHVVLAYSAYQFATAERGDGMGAQEAASSLLSVQFGGTLLGLLGTAFLAAAAFQAKKGLNGSFMSRISRRAPRATRWIGAIGYLARAAVFIVIGWSLVRVGFFSGDSHEVKTLGDAVASLTGQRILFPLVASGLLAFGLFSLVLARFRIIPDLAAQCRIQPSAA